MFKTVAQLRTISWPLSGSFWNEIQLNFDQSSFSFSAHRSWRRNEYPSRVQMEAKHRQTLVPVCSELQTIKNNKQKNSNVLKEVRLCPEVLQVELFLAEPVNLSDFLLMMMMMMMMRKMVLPSNQEDCSWHNDVVLQLIESRLGWAFPSFQTLF